MAKFTRRDGETMPEFQARCRAEQPPWNHLIGRSRKRARVRHEQRTAEQRNADRIDGYDRDNLGESPDY